MLPSLEIIAQAMSQLKHPLTKRQLNVQDDIINMYYQKNKLFMTFAFPQAHSASFRQFQRELLQILKRDLQIQQIKLQFALTKNQMLASSPFQLNDRFSQALFIILTTKDSQLDTADRTISIAKRYAQNGKKVAIIDGELQDSAIPAKLHINNKRVKVDGAKILPFMHDNLAIISTSLLVPYTMPMLWRLPMIEQVFNQFLHDVAWDPTTNIFLFHLPEKMRQFIPILYTLISPLTIEELTQHEEK